LGLFNLNLKALKYYEELFICAYCAYCVNNNAACPTFLSTNHEISTGRGKLITARNLAQGKLSNEEGLEALATGLFQCTFCGACEEECLVNIPLMKLYSELKGLVQEKLPKNTQKLFSNLSKTKNIYGLDQEDRDLWKYPVEEIYDKWVNKPNEIGYFIGCVSSYSGRAGATPATILQLASNAKKPITIFSPNEFCCGNPYLLGGQIEEARELAKHNVREITKLGIKTLILSCAGCYRVFTKKYPELLEEKLPFSVITHMEFLLNLISDKKLIIDKNSPITVTFKDPCELGRHCGVYDIPRTLIEALPGVKNAELENNRENALCCGAGGLVKANYSEMAGDIANILINQMEEKKIDLCLNACPSCLLNIDEFLKKRKSSIKAIDISQLVLDRSKSK
jgi:heterodisulfide reductase subunit D